MTISPQRAKWILALVCLVLAFCLVQRSFNLPPQPVVSITAHSAAVDDGASSDKPCALGAAARYRAAVPRTAAGVDRHALPDLVCHCLAA